MIDAASVATGLADRYRLERELGRGGMATVYLAHDLRHDRKVAIKVLHPELAAVLGSDRFLQEIRVTAHLQHPHILALYDSGTAADILYYVMPYVEGESLRQHLKQHHQLPIPDAVRLAVEVAEALDYAHRHGVIHRDIKPENILLQEGRAVVADFGIALAVRNAGGERITQTGLSLGTPQYMSPEQATAEREIDARSDQYSLACVLYEMLTGEPPHTGSSTHAVIAKIVTDRPTPVRHLRETVSPELSAAVHKALAKLPADRFGSSAEFASALSKPASTSATALPARGAGAGRRVVWALGAAVVLLAIALAWTLGNRGSRPQGALLPTQLTITAPDISAATLTTDGTTIVYLSRATGSGWVKVRRLDQLEPSTLSGSPFLYAPAVSPDGRWLAARSLAGDPILVPMGPGNSRVVARGRSYFAWHPDGSLWLSRSPFQTLERFVPGRDSLEVMRTGISRRAWLQQILDDGETGLVVEVPPGSGSGPLSTINLKTGVLTPLLEGPVVQARYSSGFLVYAGINGGLGAAPFDPDAVRISGPSVQITEAGTVNGPGDALFAVASNGTLVYGPDEPESLVLVDRNGSARLATDANRIFHAPQFSRDGNRVAMDVTSGGGRDVWILDIDQGTLSRATFDSDGHDPTWMPDGRRITYTTFRTGVFGIFRAQLGGNAPPESLLASTALNHTGQWLPDTSGLIVVATDLNPGSAQDIGIVRNGGHGPLEPLVASSFQESFPDISPDGHWLAFVSDQSGEPRVYARSMRSDGGQVQVSQAGGSEPVWGPDGREIFYRTTGDGANELIAARIETSPELRVLSRQALFPLTDYSPATPHASYDVSPDGKKFAMVKRNAASRLIVLQNFPEFVRRLQTAPTR